MGNKTSDVDMVANYNLKIIFNQIIDITLKEMNTKGFPITPNCCKLFNLKIKLSCIKINVSNTQLPSKEDNTEGYKLVVFQEI